LNFDRHELKGLKVGRKFKLLLFLTCATLLAFSGIVQGNNANYHVKAPLFPSSPKIDGKLDEPFWQNATILDSFTQYEPQEGGQPTENTVAYLGYDSKNLYIGVKCYDSNPKAVRACLAKRDQVYGDDGITIFLDTFNDQKRAFAFQVNPCGVQNDGIYTETRRRGRGRGSGMFGFDRNWDTFLMTDASQDEEGYTIEMAIPFKSLRFPNRNPQTWGLQIKREIRRKSEEIYWAPRSRSINGFLIQAGTVEIDGDIEQGKNIEIMPVVTGLKQNGVKFDPEAGLNFKYGITSDLTADMALNPDFSQIEADMPQIDVNQRYALYYPEKRPFFLEGQDIFDTPFELVYTRKIVNPLWGAKLTGQVGKWTLGFLSAYDENAVGIDIPLGSEAPIIATPQSMVSVFRIRRDLFSESYIGFILTDKELGNSWNSLANNHNRVAGIDGHFKFKNYYRVSFQIVGSHSKVGEEKTDIVPAMSFSISRQARHLQLSVDYNSLPPDFEASTGFFRRKDVKSLSSRVSYAFLPQNDLIISIRPSFEYRRIYDFDNTLTDEQFNFSGWISGWKNSHLWGVFRSTLERYGGIDFKKKTFMINLTSDPLSWLSGNINLSFGDGIYYSYDPYLGYKTSYGLRLTLKPLTNLRLFYNITNNKFFKQRGGKRVYNINIFSQRISFQISRTLSLRLITDYNDYYKKLYNSLLLSWELRPGTVFYLGIDDNQEQDESGIFRGQGRYIFIKFSYWWRI
jgi:hypothetical protein